MNILASQVSAMQINYWEHKISPELHTRTSKTRTAALKPKLLVPLLVLDKLKNEKIENSVRFRVVLYSNVYSAYNTTSNESKSKQFYSAQHGGGG